MTAQTVDWIGEPVTIDGVTERRFDVHVDGRVVPAALWTPEGASGPRPLVLMGHGATRHKRVDYIVAMAGELAGRHGFAVVSIDAPLHGDRRPDYADEMQMFADFLAEWARQGAVDDMLTDWSATIDAVRSLDEVGDGPLGYWGLSMGTIYGIPLAANEPRVQAAVFGLMGLVGPTAERLAADARRLACPITFLQQWDDSMIARQPVLDLFDAIGSIDKRLHVHPGEHAAVPVEEVEYSVAFLTRHLAPHDGA